MLSALALVTVLVQPGDTLSGIAASHGVSLAAIEGANPQISDFNVIYPGESVHLPGGAAGSAPSAPVHHYRTAHTSTAAATTSTAAATTYSSPSSTATVTGMSFTSNS